MLHATGYDAFVTALATSHLVLADAASVREASAALGVPAGDLAATGVRSGLLAA